LLDKLTDRLSGVIKKIRGWGSINEKNIQDALREVRLALLEADVNYKVVKRFIDEVSKEAIGEKVLKSLTPAQVFTKIVYDNLVQLLGGRAKPINVSPGQFFRVLLVGLQGSGKTTTVVKMGKYLKENYHVNPLIVAADIYRPAAVKQLELLSSRIGLEVYYREGLNPVKIAEKAASYARKNNFSGLIVDTAGRLEIDDEMMNELVMIEKAIKPDEILLVADAATGQAAVSIAQGFDEKLGITGIILSRMDSDARGGAALSMAYITGKQIRFIGTGEKIADFDLFYPDRIAQRILNMGDILTLVEKVQKDIDLEEAKKLEKKLKKNKFDLEDFLQQIKKIRKMGPIEELLEMIPGFSGKLKFKIDERELKKAEAIINSMTPEERANYKIINGSRRKRIAMGSGTTVFDVNRLLNNFQQMKKMMKKMGKGGKLRSGDLSSLLGGI